MWDYDYDGDREDARADARAEARRRFYTNCREGVCGSPDCYSCGNGDDEDEVEDDDDEVEDDDDNQAEASPVRS